MSSIEISDSAVDYLAGLLEKQGDDVLGVRVFINNPGTPRAETCLAYCREDDIKEDDIKIAYSKFDAYIEKRSEAFLEDAVVDFAEEKMGGQLTIKAPNSKMPRVDDDSPIEDRVNYVLYNEVNPALAAHGGEVSLVEITDESVAVLQFGGGCQGCGMVDTTLKDGVEKTLLDQVTGLSGVTDVTDHSDRSQAYFK